MQRTAILPPAFITGILAGISIVFWPTVREIVGLGQSADAAGALILAAFAGMVWTQRFELAALRVRPCAWGFVGLAAAGLAWLVAQIVFVQALAVAAVLAMVGMTVLAVLGSRWFAAMVFPLAYLFLAVPLWDPLKPLLAAHTADVAVAALSASGIPILRQGAFFSIPSGSWSVADECSGLAHFTVCLLLGVVYAWLMYRSLRKRALFVAGALVIGIVGNWLRVYLTVAIAHLSDNRLLRDDHYAFGWVLYALMILLYGYLGQRFADPPPERCESEAPAPGRHPGNARVPAAAGAAAALMLLMAWPLIEQASATPPFPADVRRVGDIAPQRGWRPASASLAWQPQLVNPTSQRVQAFEKGGKEVFVFTGLYASQSWTSKLVSSVNQLASSDDLAWTRTALGSTQPGSGGALERVNTGVILGPAERIVAWQWYWIDGVSTASGLRAKWRQLASRLQGRPDAGVWVAIYARSSAVDTAGAAVLDEFLRDMGGALEHSLAASVARG